MHWFVSAWNTATGRSVVRVGDEPDMTSAIDEAIRIGRNLTHADDGSLTGPARNFRFGDGDVVSIRNADAEVAAEDIFTAVERELRYADQLRNPASIAPVTKYATAPTSVVEQWNRIATWLRRNVSDVRITSASDGEVAATAAATAVNWHHELSTFYGLVDGIHHDHWISLLPSHELFGLDRLLDERRIELEVWGDIDREVGVTPSRATPAGESVGSYLPEFVPFAGLDGNLLFVDMRGGPLFGCVTEFDKVDADQGGPRWLSLSAMLADLADSLESGSTFDGSWTPRVDSGTLTWAWNN